MPRVWYYNSKIHIESNEEADFRFVEKALIQGSNIVNECNSENTCRLSAKD